VCNEGSLVGPSLHAYVTLHVRICGGSGWESTQIYPAQGSKESLTPAEGSQKSKVSG